MRRRERGGRADCYKAVSIRIAAMKPSILLKLFVLLWSLVVGVGDVRADPRIESPGWYSARIGRITVTALFDGTISMPVDKEFSAPAPARLNALLARDGIGLTVPMAVNAVVIETGQRIVMVDAGTGALKMFGEGLGRVPSNLRAAGYTPEQIDEIYLTHLHADHVGGLTIDGRAVYPNATVRADTREAGHDLSRAKLAAAGDEKADFENAIAMLDPYVKSGRFKPFDGAIELVAGVKALPAHGHTPGHTAYVVESDGEKLLLWGDLVHVGAIELPLPTAAMAFEADPAQARASRLRVLRDAARDRTWIAAAHLGFPGIGQVRAEARGGGYSWLPMALVRGR